MKTLPLALAAALALAPSAAAQKAQGKPWFSEVLLQAPAKLGGCAIGNFDPDSPGKEAAAVCENGMVFLVRQDGGGDWPWNGRRVAQAPGELIQCFAANVLSETEADELVVYGASRGREDDGGPGIAYLGALDERGLLELTPLLQDEALLHGGTLANLDPRHRGNEIVLGGFSKKLHVLHREGADWIPEVAVEMDAPIKAITPWRDGVAVGTTDGKLTLVQRVDDGWRSVLLEATGAGHARLAAFAGILLSARDDGGLLRVDTNFKTQRVFQGKEKLRGAALGSRSWPAATRAS